MTTTNTAGYLTSFAATYQVEGVTEAQAAAVAARVQQALTQALEELATTIAFDEAGRDRRVLAVRVERQGALVEEYDAR
ncbi:hypothetical protein [Mycolicibacterium fortuitum]|uniref:hypothetical protein n=1 Tax=Mycolicibacterium fortuitum TaxID=1766 RepID=UPI001AF01FE5|nr:hypothetical protein [Mycolicibacterium fortuitum]MBP3086929.1 hypothetical protein [Mycolicibacterium fortuitum]